MTEKEMEDGVVFITSTVLDGQKRDHSCEMIDKQVYTHRKIYTSICI